MVALPFILSSPDGTCEG